MDYEQQQAERKKSRKMYVFYICETKDGNLDAKKNE